MILTKKEITKEWVTFLFNLTATALGFFIALSVTSSIENQKEKESYNTFKRMIINETKINQIIVDSSYLHFGYETQGLIFFSELTTNVSMEMIKDEKFVASTNDDALFAIQNYHRYIKLLNTYKTELNAIRRNPDRTELDASWADAFANSINRKRGLLLKSIKDIQENLEKDKK